MKINHIILGLLAIFMFLGGCLSTNVASSDESDSFYYPGQVLPKSGGAVYQEEDYAWADSKGIATPSVAPTSDGRYETKEGSVRIEVEGSLEAALGRAKTILASKNAEITSLYYDEYYGTERYLITFKVLPVSFDSTLSELDALGDITNMNVQIQDVTREYVDLDIRLKNKRVELERLYVLYNQTQSVEELLAVEKEISRLTSDIELLTSQQEALQGRISQSTVVLELYALVGVPESQEAQLSLKVSEGSIENKLTNLKSIVSSQNGEITSLQFSDNSYEKHYEILVRVPSSNLESTLERMKDLGEIKYFTTTVNEENRPKESLISVRLVEEKPSVQRNFLVPLDDLGAWFFGAFSIGIMAVVALLGLLIPIGAIVVVAKKVYAMVKKKDSVVVEKSKK